jgi:uncharacterized protein YigE (DUF2233 family)
MSLACRCLRWAPVLLLAAVGARAVECTHRHAGSFDVSDCRVDLQHEQLQLYWRDDSGQPYRRFSVLRDSLLKQGKTLVFAVNGGMYRPDYSPVGLFVSDSRVRVPLNRHTGSGNFSQQPNGVFLVEGQSARVLSTQEYSDQMPAPTLATQSGPMLLHQGAVTESPVMNPASSSRRIRNGVCAPSPHVAAFVSSESPVTFYEFARYFLDRVGCRDALYLDGSISSVYFPALELDDNWFDLGPIFGVARLNDAH